MDETNPHSNEHFLAYLLPAWWFGLVLSCSLPRWIRRKLCILGPSTATPALVVPYLLYADLEVRFAAQPTAQHPRELTCLSVNGAIPATAFANVLGFY